jgi:hypothetical protein
MNMKPQAIEILRPNAKWTLRGDSLDQLEWLDTEQTQPTQEEINAKESELIAAEPLKLLRAERNAKLTETDWVITMHKELGTNIPAAWKTYRQALRDITDTYTSLDDVVWPEKPE